MSQFPLYTTLLINLPEKDLTVAQKTDFVRKVLEVDAETHGLIYALIKSYFLDQDRGEPMVIPYKGTLVRDRIDFDLADFPPKLRQLLYKFISIHRRKVQEDNDIKRSVEAVQVESSAPPPEPKQNARGKKSKNKPNN